MKNVTATVGVLMYRVRMAKIECSLPAVSSSQSAGGARCRQEEIRSVSSKKQCCATCTTVNIVYDQYIIFRCIVHTAAVGIPVERSP